MKSFFSFALLLISCFQTSFAQPGIIWENTFGGTYTDKGVDIVELPDGGFLALGEPYSINGDVTNPHGVLDYWLLKLSPLGELIWQKSFGGSNEDAPVKIIPTLDGNYFILGSSLSVDGDVLMNHGGMDVWLLKVNSEGDILWQKSYGGTLDDYASTITPTNDGNFMISCLSFSSNGDVPSTNKGEGDLWVIKIDPDGTILWSKLYGGNGLDIAGTIHPTSDGGYIIGGSSSSTTGDGFGNHGGSDTWILKIASNGILMWRKVLGGTNTDFTAGLVITPDGGFMVLSYCASKTGAFIGNHGGFDFWAYKLSPSGTFLWQKFYGGSAFDVAEGITSLSNGNYLLYGYAQSSDGDLIGNSGSNAWVICVDQNGAIIWKKTYGGSQSDSFRRIKERNDGSLIVIGLSASMDGDVQSGSGPSNAGDAWVVLLGTATDVFSPNSNQFKIRIAPNPASNFIEIQAPENFENGTVSILGIDGSVVLKQDFQPGRPIDVAGLQAGSYVIRIENRREYVEGKMIKY